MPSDKENIATLMANQVADRTTIKLLINRIDDLERERRNAFRAGISILGAGCVGLIIYIWQHR